MKNTRAAIPKIFKGKAITANTDDNNNHVFAGLSDNTSLDYLIFSSQLFFVDIFQIYKQISKLDTLYIKNQRPPEGSL